MVSSYDILKGNVGAKQQGRLKVHLVKFTRLY